MNIIQQNNDTEKYNVGDYLEFPKNMMCVTDYFQPTILSGSAIVQRKSATINMTLKDFEKDLNATNSIADKSNIINP